MRCAVRYLTICAIVLAHSPAVAYELLQRGTIVKPNANLSIRNRLPGGFFQGLGDEIGKTNPKDNYIVRDSKAVPNLTGSEQWLNVEPLDPNGKPKNDGAGGWVYGGTGKLDNFQVDDTKSNVSTSPPKDQ
jgi:hypothetical protein